jgi:hypothetical protein
MGLKIIGAVLAVVTVMASADYIYQRNRPGGSARSGRQHMIGQPDGGRFGTAEKSSMLTLPTRWKGAFA